MSFADPEEGSCELNKDPRLMWNGLKPAKPRSSGRIDHSSAVNENRILSMGGLDSRRTKWILVDVDRVPGN